MITGSTCSSPSRRLLEDHPASTLFSKDAGIDVLATSCPSRNRNLSQSLKPLTLTKQAARGTAADSSMYVHVIHIYIYIYTYIHIHTCTTCEHGHTCIELSTVKVWDWGLLWPTAVEYCGPMRISLSGPCFFSNTESSGWACTSFQFWLGVSAWGGVDMRA